MGKGSPGTQHWGFPDEATLRLGHSGRRASDFPPKLKGDRMKGVSNSGSVTPWIPPWDNHPEIA